MLHVIHEYAYKLTLCGASCSETSHFNSEAFGKCFSENFFSSEMAIDSAEPGVTESSMELKKMDKIINTSASMHIVN